MDKKSVGSKSEESSLMKDKKGISRRQYLAIAGGAIAAAVIGGTAYYLSQWRKPAPGPGKPIRIGLPESLSGALSAAGMSVLLATQIWVDDVNSKGGLLGRPVELVFYDAQSNPSLGVSLVEKLFTVDKVDIVLEPYASLMGIPCIPVFIEHNAICPALFNLWGNEKFNYKYYFELMPDGPIPPLTGKTKGLFELAEDLEPKPETVALLGVANEWGQRSITEGAEPICQEKGFNIVYKEIYPPDTTDFLPIANSVKAANPDFVYAATYPTDAVGLIKAFHELGYRSRLQFGGMVGLQYTSIQMSLGPLLNGIVNYHYFIPSPTMRFPGIEEFLNKYQAKAAGLGIDPLGYYLPPFAYARMQVIEQAVEATGTLDHAELGEYIKTHEFETIVNPKLRFAENGEWEKEQYILIQFRNIQSSDISEFTCSFDKPSNKMVIVWPPEFATGEFVE